MNTLRDAVLRMKGNCVSPEVSEKSTVGSKMKRGRSRQCHQVPVRTRRRQSDAKWRASVASCYETLKFIIPSGKMMPKRKASKSLILQETEKHIGILERAVSRLLNIDAQDQGHGVLWEHEGCWVPATLSHLQQEFVKQQSEIFHQSSQGRRYNMLQDIQEEILNLSADHKKMAFLPLAFQNFNGDRTTRDAATCTSRSRIKVTKARCRFETERACQRVLAAYENEEVVDAMVLQPLDAARAATTITSSLVPECSAAGDAQAVPVMTPGPSGLTLTNGHSFFGKTLRLKKMGQVFVSENFKEDGAKLEFQSLSGLDRMTLKRHSDVYLQGHNQKNLQEVPEQMTDEEFKLECKIESLAVGTTLDQHQLASPAGFGYSNVRSEKSVKEINLGCFSNVCKKLDFNLLSPHHKFADKKHKDSCFSSLLNASGSGFTPLKSVASATENEGAFMSPRATDLVPLNDMTVFSPTRLLEPYDADNVLSSPTSVWALDSVMDARVPQAGLSSLDGLADLSTDQNLLCMESFDLDEDESYPDLKTPHKLSSGGEESFHSDGTQYQPVFKKKCKRSKRECSHTAGSADQDATVPLCRKNLDGLFEKQQWKEVGSKETSGEPVIAGIFDCHTDWSDMDGYLLYQKQVVSAMNKQMLETLDPSTLAGIISNMWAQLPSDDRHTMVTLAALENHDSNSSASNSLSLDLEEVNVTPVI